MFSGEALASVPDLTLIPGPDVEGGYWPVVLLFPRTCHLTRIIITMMMIKIMITVI